MTNKRDVLNRALKTFVETLVSEALPLFALLDWSDTSNFAYNVLIVVVIPALATAVSVVWNKYDNYIFGKNEEETAEETEAVADEGVEAEPWEEPVTEEDAEVTDEIEEVVDEAPIEWIDEEVVG